MSGNDSRGGGSGQASSDSELSARLRQLEAQIDRKRPPAPADPSSRPRDASGPSSLGQALTLSTEFVAGVVAGGALGWIFDRFLGTKPWGLIVLLLLGFVAGVYNVMRSSGFARPPAGAGDPADAREGDGNRR